MQLAETAISQLPKLDCITQSSTKRWSDLIDQLAATGIGNCAFWPSAIVNVARAADEIQHIIEWRELYVASSEDVREGIWNNYDVDTKSRATKAMASIGKIVGIPLAEPVHNIVVGFVSMPSVDMVVIRMRGALPENGEELYGGTVQKVGDMDPGTRVFFSSRPISRLSFSSPKQACRNSYPVEIL